MVRIYADRPGASLRQFVTDLFVIAWVVFWIYAATRVYDTVLKLAVPGQKLEGAGAGMASGLADAGNRVGGLPAVGDALSAPFDKAAGAAEALADAGRAQQEAVQNLALTLVVLLLVVPFSLVVFVWLPLRLQWIRRATHASRLRRMQGGRDLLALRALSNQPLRRLTRLHVDAARAWREGDERTMNALAALELRTLGLEP